MAIINVTSDSFSGDGIADAADVATAAAQLATAAEQGGADIIDVGAMSTRPGASEIPVEVERDRIRVAIEGIMAATSLPVSVDTYRAEVAQSAVASGASIINSIWGISTPSGEPNGALIDVVASTGVGIVLTHNRPAVATHGPLGSHVAHAAYDNVVDDIVAVLSGQLASATDAGINRRQVIVDPGIGFGKTPAQSVDALRSIPRLKQELGLPVLVGASRKSTLGYLLGDPNRDRAAATIAVTALAAAARADIVRVHDVAPNVDAARVASLIARWDDEHSNLTR
jgi:dihydropteroate synthase